MVVPALVDRRIVVIVIHRNRSAYPAHGRPTVLHICVHEIWHLIVDSYVIHLPNRQNYAVKASTVHSRDDQPAIVGNHKAVRVQRIDPDVVSIASPRHRSEDFSAVQRPVEVAARHQHFILVHGGDG